MVKKDVKLVFCLFVNGQMWRCLNQNGIGIPSFCKALKNGQKAGLKVWCISTKLTKNQMIFSKELPYLYG